MEFGWQWSSFNNEDNNSHQPHTACIFYFVLIEGALVTEFTNRVFNTAQLHLAHEASNFSPVQSKLILSEQLVLFWKRVVCIDPNKSILLLYY